MAWKDRLDLSAGGAALVSPKPGAGAADLALGSQPGGKALKPYRFFLVAVLGLAAFAAQASSKRVPVMIGGSAVFDACPSAGVIARLGPRRAEDPKSGFLSVRSGPGGSAFFELDRLYNGDAVLICDGQGPWHAVVYPGQGQSMADCGPLGSSIRVRRAYEGPCRSGWVHRNYVEITAG